MSAQLPPSTLPVAGAHVLAPARSDAEYTLAVPADARRELARGWLAPGPGALILSDRKSVA